MLKSTVVIIPSLNPDEHLKETIAGLKEAGFRAFIIVDDGSDDEHQQYFPEKANDTVVLHHETNLGKGAALKTAFKYIEETTKNIKYMVTVDGDGQHAPEDAKKCVEALGNNTNAVVLGARCFKEDNVPLRSKIGNNITLFVFHKLCGIKISDTQTGLRAFSTALIPSLLTIEGDRFEYETNMLLKFKQRGVEILEVPIQTVYIEENHASHFRTVQDSFLVYKFILAYVASSAISFIVDVALFHLLCKVFAFLPVTQMTFLATGIARLFSSLLNYNLNKRKVFDYEDPEEKKKDHTLIKYYALAIPQMCISASLVTLIVYFLPKLAAIETLIKIIVDAIIFLVNYRVQRVWVFTSAPASNDSIKDSEDENDE
ncbi:MAG: bifunctional glycosyltransferase family 2/GtrA family protein [Oscillospiraceae bacterium]|nr:bifunctional glycosyltransferase family 2/GtrA family protein [Candidatus Limimonas egerieequi]